MTDIRRNDVGCNWGDRAKASPLADILAVKGRFSSDVTYLAPPPDPELQRMLDDAQKQVWEYFHATGQMPDLIVNGETVN